MYVLVCPRVRACAYEFVCMCVHVYVYIHTATLFLNTVPCVDTITLML